MSKPSDFYLGVLDFFGALLPGSVTLGTAVFLDLPAGLPREVGKRAGDGSIAIAAFVVLAFVVGQIANAIGSAVLDFFYDLLYAPGKGWWSEPAKAQPKAKSNVRISLGEHAWRTLTSFIDEGKAERASALKAQLATETGEKEEDVGNVYQTVRSYLRVRVPQAFVEVEKLEGDQKFFRSLTVGTGAVALLLFSVSPESIHGWGWWLASLSASSIVFFSRYVAVRRKTVERAYTYFRVRRCVAGATASESKSDD